MTWDEDFERILGDCGIQGNTLLYLGLNEPGEEAQEAPEDFDEAKEHCEDFNSSME